jgi:hypothetical protein
MGQLELDSRDDLYSPAGVADRGGVGSVARPQLALDLPAYAQG